MAGFLRCLTESDERALLARARHERFDADQVILAEGDRRHAVFVLDAGAARIERAHMDFYVEIARLGPGDIFGEMSFVEGYEASASVVADGPCEVSIIDGEHVESMIASDPGFYGRFYHSIAEILSRRLRETTVAGIAEYAWGGHDVEGLAEGTPGARPSTDDIWGGGSPVRDFAADDASGGDPETP